MMRGLADLPPKKNRASEIARLFRDVAFPGKHSLTPPLWVDG